MGNNQNYERRLGIVKPRPTQKEVERTKNVERHHMQRAQRKAIKVFTNTITPTLQPIVIIREKEVWEAAHEITLYI
jgi:hypothetical protein